MNNNTAYSPIVGSYFIPHEVTVDEKLQKIREKLDAEKINSVVLSPYQTAMLNGDLPTLKRLFDKHEIIVIDTNPFLWTFVGERIGEAEYACLLFAKENGLPMPYF